MDDLPAAGLIALVVGIILLWLEYRTGWFASQLSSVVGSRESGGIIPTGSADTVCQVKVRLGEIHGADPDEIIVRHWESQHFGQWIYLQVTLPVRSGAGERVWQTFEVLADRDGGIIRCTPLPPERSHF
jgi:hypothetical protein